MMQRFWGYRRGLGMHTVVLEKCTSYNQDEVDNAVSSIFSHYGGVKKLFEPGQTVFLKVNLVMKKKPEEAVTTHPAVVEAVAKQLLRHGCRVIIGDSPGGPFTPIKLKGIYKATGMEEVARITGSELNYNVECLDVSYQEGHIVKSLTVAKAMWEADALISLGKLKTHGMTTYTGAAKNLFGTIPGLLKAEYHFKMPNLDDFAHMLVDICEAIKPAFSIIDGVVGMEGEGPTAGKPKQVNAIIAGINPHEVDVIGASLMGLEINRVPTLKAAKQRGLITEDNDIKVVGYPIEKLKVQKFVVPNTRQIHFYRGKFPLWLERYLDKWLTPNPVFQHHLCSGCEVCKKHCPPGVITMKQGRPVVELNKCIRCFCCQELCPAKAVMIKRPWIIKKILRN